MEQVFNTEYGVAKVKDVMIDLDQYNLEEGIDVYIDGEYEFSALGESTNIYLEELEKLIELHQ